MRNRLMDYVTGDYLRAATADEIAQCREVVEEGCEEGIILVDTRSEWPDYPESARRCWVDGDLSPVEEITYDSDCEDYPTVPTR